MHSVLILIFLCVFLPLKTFAAEMAPIDIIFDIDWTAFYSIEKSQKDSQTVMVEGKLYRPTDYFVETVEWLLVNHPEVRISFFSGGERSRNEALLDKVHLSDGRSLKDISFRIFSKEHLLVLSQDPELKFAERYKKDVSTLLPDWNPERSLLIDDQVIFAKPPLKAVSSLGTYNFQRAFNPQMKDEKFFPPSLDAWKFERNKALVWSALLDKAFRVSYNGSRSFAEAAQESWNSQSIDASLANEGRNLVRPFSARFCGKVFGF